MKFRAQYMGYTYSHQVFVVNSNVTGHAVFLFGKSVNSKRRCLPASA